MDSQKKIVTYEDLIAERDQLQQQIANQKNIIRHNLAELKSEFKREIRPAIDAGNAVKKFISPTLEEKKSLLKTGLGFAVNQIAIAAFSKTGFITRIAGPIAVKFVTRLALRKKTNRTQA